MSAENGAFKILNGSESGNVCLIFAGTLHAFLVKYSFSLF